MWNRGLPVQFGRRRGVLAMVVFSESFPSLILYEGERVEGYRVDVEETDKLIEHYIGMEISRAMERRTLFRLEVEYQEIWKKFRSVFDQNPSDFIVWDQCDA